MFGVVHDEDVEFAEGWEAEGPAVGVFCPGLQKIALIIQKTGAEDVIPRRKGVPRPAVVAVVGGDIRHHDVLPIAPLLRQLRGLPLGVA
ncbi:unnamed protein product [Phytomonas sp. Hart1]|nr:unnamed protein product [Phytomonas sp. Hart1]|eukprot:CCW66862.1 unnamed protein product [Phytomonas sp. isolate Hart1]